MGLSRHPLANLIHNLKMWNGATGRAGVCSASLWHKEGVGVGGGGGERNGLLFQFIK